MTSLTRTLIRLRFRWYRDNMFVFLERYSHMIVITLLCLLPVAQELKTALEIAAAVSLPVKTIVAEQSTGYWLDIALVAILHTVFVSWLVVQGRAVTGQPLATYLASLPIARRDRRLVDMCTVAYANHLTWLMFLLPLFLAPYSELRLDGTVLFVLRTAILALTTVGIQMAWVFGLRREALVFLLLDAVLVASKWLPSAGGSIAATVLLLLVTAWMVAAPPQLPVYPRSPPRPSRPVAAGRGWLRTGRAPFLIEPILSVYLRVLFSEKRISTVVRLVLAVTVTLLGAVITARNVSTGVNWSANYAVVFAVLLTFLCSGFYRPIYEARQSFESYLRALPIGKYTWIALDTTLVAGVVLLIELPSIAYLLAKEYLSIEQSLVLIPLQLPLLLFLYPIRNKMATQSSAVSVFVSVIWTLLMLAMVP